MKAGHLLSEADPYDLFPTMAWLLGLPISDELEGEVLEDAFQMDFVRSQPIIKVTSYGPREVRALQRSAEDAGMLESLRALGYIQ